MSKKYISLLPDEAFGFAAGSRPQIVIDTESGLIAMAGDAADVGPRLEAEKAGGAEVIEEISGGALLPGLTDAHYHVMVYAAFDLFKAVMLVGSQDKHDVLKRLKSAADRLKDPDDAVFAVALDTSKAGGITRGEIDEAVGGRSAFALDVSLHGGFVSSAMAKRIQAEADKMGRPLVGFMRDNGAISEEYTIKALELIESGFTTEQIVGAIEKKVVSFFSKGVTTLHDLMPSTSNQFVAAMMLRKKWAAERGCEFPITRFYLARPHIQDVLDRLPELETNGLLMRDEMASFIGLKMFVDGSIGARTAKMSAPYVDTGTDGIFFVSAEQLRDDMKFAAANGFKEIAIHAIGDDGIRLALDAAAEWRAISGAPDAKCRIEHFQVPIPVDEAVRRAKDCGAYLCMQPCFLLDYTYEDRLGRERVENMCPHKAIHDAGVPTFWGTDGMPDSMLFGIFCAANAPNEGQTLSYEKGIEASCAAVADYEGDNRGRLEEGCKADLVLADKTLFASLARQEGAPAELSMMKMFELEGKVKRVFKNGVQVVPRPKPAKS